MKSVILTAIIILFAISVHAQTGMPQELTCTEKAFNFSFSLGSKWKLSTIKMGPVEVASYKRDYIPALLLKTPTAAHTVMMANQLKDTIAHFSFSPVKEYTLFKSSLLPISFQQFVY